MQFSTINTCLITSCCDNNVWHVSEQKQSISSVKRYNCLTTIAKSTTHNNNLVNHAIYPLSVAISMLIGSVPLEMNTFVLKLQSLILHVFEQQKVDGKYPPPVDLGASYPW